MMEKIDDQVETVSDEIATFIVDDLKWEGTKQELLGSDPVELPFALDSTDLLELAGYLEDTFRIEIADEEIIADNFASVRRLAELIVEKQAGSDSL
jgi:acyl carrier protein